MALDPTKHADWEIAEDSEKRMKPIAEIARKMGLKDEEILLHGHHIAKIDFKQVLKRYQGKPDGKYIDVTAITPTPLGEGKSTCHHGAGAGTR